MDATKEAEKLTRGFDENKSAWDAVEKHLRDELAAAAANANKTKATRDELELRCANLEEESRRAHKAGGSL